MSLQSDSKTTPNADSMPELVQLTSALDLSNKITNEAEEEEEKKDCIAIKAKPQKSIDDLLLESYECLQNKRQNRLDMNTLSSWTNLGERKVSFDENSKFADEKIVQKLYSAYLEYEMLTEIQRRKKKQKVNPLEAVKKGFLLNRTAIKFANIDSLLDYMFSAPVDKMNRSLIQPNELMYFVDICGGPGGFADYLLWRRDWQTKGFGIPLKNANYWTNKFTVGGQRFNIFKGAKRDGDVTNDENIKSIVRYVKQHISLGVHVVIADSAFDVQTQKFAKETIFKRMHLGETILALSLLRSNGHFIIKLFDVLLPFTVGLVYLLHKCFAEVFFLKPRTSRPSSAERYLICKWKYNDTENVRMYLEDVNTKLNSVNSSNLDVTHLVPDNVLLNDAEFHSFICKSNNFIAETQTEAIFEILQLTANNSEVSSPDPLLIETCLEQWNVLPKTDVVFDCTFGRWAQIVHFPENQLSPLLPLCDSFNLPGDRLGNEWHCIFIENINNGNRTFFSTKNSTDVLMLDPISSDWIPVPHVGLEFPTNTFLYGEIVNHHVHHSDITAPQGFHIIDGMVLNGQDIRHHPYSMRLELCKKFADAVNNPSRFVKTQDGETVRSATVNCKETFLLNDLIPEMEKFRKSWKTTRSGSKVLGHNVQTFVGPKRFYPVNGLLFLRNFPKINDETNFTETFQCRQSWIWPGPDALNTVDIAKTPADGNIYLSHFCEYMNRSVGQEVGALSWRDKNSQRIPSKYSRNRGRGKGGATGRSGRGSQK